MVAHKGSALFGCVCDLPRTTREACRSHRADTASDRTGGLAARAPLHSAANAQAMGQFTLRLSSRKEQRPSRHTPWAPRRRRHAAARARATRCHLGLRSSGSLRNSERLGMAGRVYTARYSEEAALRAAEARSGVVGRACAHASAHARKRRGHAHGARRCGAHRARRGAAQAERDGSTECPS